MLLKIPLHSLGSSEKERLPELDEDEEVEKIEHRPNASTPEKEQLKKMNRLITKKHRIADLVRNETFDVADNMLLLLLSSLFVVVGRYD